MTSDHVLEAMALLQANWPGGDWSPRSEEVFSLALDDIDPDAVSAAARRAIRELTFCPKPAEIRLLALELAAARQIERTQEAGAPPVDADGKWDPDADPWYQAFLARMTGPRISPTFEDWTATVAARRASGVEGY